MEAGSFRYWNHQCYTSPRLYPFDSLHSLRVTVVGRFIVVSRLMEAGSFCYKIFPKKIHAIRIACKFYFYMGFANIILPADVCSTDVTSTRIVCPI